MNLTFDTPNVLASLQIDETPIYAFTGTVFQSRLSYGHRIDFLIAHRYRFQIRELQALVTSFVYSRATSNEEAYTMLVEIQQSLLADIRHSLSTGYAIEDLARFVIDNYLFVKSDTLILAGKSVRVDDDLRDIKVGDILNAAYHNILTPPEIRHLVMCVGNATNSLCKAVRV